MPIEPVKIPQNVYVEDRIIGPITLRHLVILGIGAGISYVIYAAVTKTGHKELPVQIACWIPLMISAGFAFLKVNDLSLLQIILLAIEGMNKPNTRYWSPHAGLSINLITRQNQKELEQAQAKAADTASKLLEMTRQLQKKQEELNRLAAHEDMQTPNATVPVQTQVDGLYASEKASEAESVVTTETSEVSSLPVNRERFKATNFKPARSIDTVVRDIKAIQDFPFSR